MPINPEEDTIERSNTECTVSKITSRVVPKWSPGSFGSVLEAVGSRVANRRNRT